MKKYVTKRSKEEVANAIIKAHGILSDAAKVLGLASVPSLRVRVKKDPELNAVLDESREQTKDLAESKLFDAIREGKDWAILFYLKCIARDRGYGEHQEVDVISRNFNANIDLSTLSLEELKQLEEITRKATKPDSD